MKPIEMSEDLRAQHKYVSGLEDKKFSYPLIAAEAFVRGMRDSGYKSTATAIDEFIDNSIQAAAKHIDIVLGYAKDNPGMKKPDVVAIVDDGHGMEPRMMKAAVLWGGTHRENDRSGFGRYGFGLPSAAVSISRRYHVYSKIPGGQWYRLTIDLDEIANGKHTNPKTGTVHPPDPKAADLPELVRSVVPGGDLPHGTVILLDALDRLSAGFMLSQKFQQKLLEHVGLTYRGLLRDMTVRVVDTAHAAGAVEVQPVDPLFLSPEAKYYDSKAEGADAPIMAEALPETVFTVKEKGSRDSTLGTVRVRYSYMPPGFQDVPGRLAIMKENNGFVVMRAGRQIDLVTKAASPDLPNFQVYDRNWKVEIDFEPTLDEEFGITTNKQQVTLSERMLDILKEKGVFAAAKALSRRYYAAAEAARDARDAGKPKASEEVHDEARRLMTRKPAPVTPEKEAQRQERLQEEIKKRVQQTGRPPAEIEAELLGTGYRVVFESLPGAPFFRVDQVGGQKSVLVNMAHRFYTDVYNGPEASPRLRTSLELLLLVLGECELDAGAELERFYRQERGEWSRRLDLDLDLLDRRKPVVDAKAAAASERERAPALVQVPSLAE